jgi:branched-chain amino acid transport system ATP-binding protein
MSLLEVSGLRTGYGMLPVLQGITFGVAEGETAVIFGLNGAGKTTTVNAIAGLLPTWEGEIRFDGRVVSGLSAPQIVKAGIALSPEGRRVFPGLSVLTNLRMGAWTRRSDRKGTDAATQQVFGYFPRLEERKDQLAGTLSGGEQQMLAIGRGCCSSTRRRSACHRSWRRRCSRWCRRSTTPARPWSSWSRTSACCRTPTRP